MKALRAAGGIDEAGLGPTLGPLVFGAVLFRGAPEALGDLRGTLAGLVERRFDPSGATLGVDDSKRLHAGPRTLLPLELPALALLHPGRPAPVALSELLPPRATAPRADCYDVPLALPTAAARETIEAWRTRLSRHLAERGVEVAIAEVDPLFEPVMNARFAAGRNKAELVLERVGPLLKRMVAAAPEGDVEIVVDRLGGRRYYGDFLRHLFPLRPLAIVAEEPERSRYRLQEGARSIEIAFEVGGDQNHLAIGWASLCAKYVRELCMAQLNAWHGARLPGLVPTAGYPQDAQRWLAATAGVLDDAQRAELVRQR